ncbi:hypothetical protein Chor_004527 [Crotalus horridus]
MADSDSLGIAEMVKRVSEQQNTQASEIQKSKEVLTQLQIYFTVSPFPYMYPAQDEILCLQSEIKILKEAVGEMENAIRDEKSRHANLQKEIELQTREAKQFSGGCRCQVNNLELERRQGRLKVQQLEEKVEELRKLWQATDE